MNIHPYITRFLYQEYIVPRNDLQIKRLCEILSTEDVFLEYPCDFSSSLGDVIRIIRYLKNIVKI